MPVSDILAAGTVMDRDSLMEFIILADRARRLAFMAGDMIEAHEQELERDALIKQWEKLR